MSEGEKSKVVRARWFGLHPDDMTAVPRHLSDAQGNNLLTEEEAGALCVAKGWQGPYKFNGSEVVEKTAMEPQGDD